MCFENGLPRQSADWLAMTGFFDSLKQGTAQAVPCFVRLRICAERRKNLYLEASSLAARFLPYIQQATT